MTRGCPKRRRASSITSTTALRTTATSRAWTAAGRATWPTWRCHLEMDERQEAVEEWMEPGPGNSPEACPLAKAGCGPSRHEGRPKSLNLPPEAKHFADAQRSFKTKTRTPEERPTWPQEEVRFWLALGKQREGPRAKVSV